MKDLTTMITKKVRIKRKAPPKTTSRNNIHVEGEWNNSTSTIQSSREEQEKRLKNEGKINSVSEINDYFPILKEGI